MDHPAPPVSGSWLGDTATGNPYLTSDTDSAFVRLWHGFMTARTGVAALLFLFQLTVFVTGPATGGWMVAVTAIYALLALAVRFLAKIRPPGKAFDSQWVYTIGLDLVVFGLLQLTQSGAMNFSPLFGLPVLLASVMGSLLLALATAAAATLILLGDAWWIWVHGMVESSARFVQAGLTGLGYFVLAVLANQLASRLSREEETARRSQMTARVQVQVNELVIETLVDGVLVVDATGIVRSANPAAHQLIGRGGAARLAPFVLAAETAWHPLVELAGITFSKKTPQTAEVSVQHRAESARRLHVRTRLTAPQEGGTESLCVMFLQDQREMEARLRTEKLAAMGRMSAAVAHEIRNPLAAITQANALLAEDLQDPVHQQLTGMVQQNARRLSQIVEEVLNIARVQHQLPLSQSPTLPLDATVQQVCDEWAQQNHAASLIRLQLGCGDARVDFETDHLRRVLVNLLDNALRYASGKPDSIEVGTGWLSRPQAGLQVWSDGTALEQGVQRHLFEPFFSSESRSSGLGLYICRELCERHQAAIGYQRSLRKQQDSEIEGNEFHVAFRPTPLHLAPNDPIDNLLI